ncbi:serine racemase isoform X5 [Columba livia]|uniref:serine racemase isoform X5 n=1 Tax=Columba livia TaxID=8932 RepID=UPI0031BA67B6
MAGLGLADVRAAERRLRDRLHRTPVLTCRGMDRLAGRRLLFKCELFQRTGSFKIRGALNAVRSLVEDTESAGRDLPRAVVTHSSGNHGQALACAAQAEVQSRDSSLCHPEDRRSPGAPQPGPSGDCGTGHYRPGGAGAGTRGKRGGGSRGRRRNDCRNGSCHQDAVKTSIGPNTWPIIRDLVDDVLTVSEEEIKSAAGRRAQAVPSAAPEQPALAAGVTAAALSRQRATRLVWERMKLLIEPTAGVGVAAVLSEQFQAVPRDVENVCIVLCGGNVDLSSLTWLTDLPGKAE